MNLLFNLESDCDFDRLFDLDLDLDLLCDLFFDLDGVHVLLLLLESDAVLRLLSVLRMTDLDLLLDFDRDLDVDRDLDLEVLSRRLSRRLPPVDLLSRGRWRCVLFLLIRWLCCR